MEHLISLTSHDIVLFCGKLWSGVQLIENEELRISSKVASRLKSCPNLLLLGKSMEDEKGLPTASKRGSPRFLPIFSFLIKFGRRFLHHNYVCALLNDLFGIQSRGNGKERNGLSALALALGFGFGL
jgi:hypothetical protein